MIPVVAGSSPVDRPIFFDDVFMPLVQTNSDPMIQDWANRLGWRHVLDYRELNSFGVSQDYFDKSISQISWYFRENEKDVCCVKPCCPVSQAFNERFVSRLALHAGIACPVVETVLFENEWGGISCVSSSPLIGTFPKSVKSALRRDTCLHDFSLTAAQQTFLKQEISRAIPFQILVQNSDWHWENVIISKTDAMEGMGLNIYSIDHVRLEWTQHPNIKLHIIEDMTSAGLFPVIDEIMLETAQVLSQLKDSDFKEITQECMAVCRITERDCDRLYIPRIDCIAELMARRRDTLFDNVSSHSYMARRCWMDEDQYVAVRAASRRAVLTAG